jgi:hypothetical protein
MSYLIANTHVRGVFCFVLFLVHRFEQGKIFGTIILPSLAEVTDMSTREDASWDDDWELLLDPALYTSMSQTVLFSVNPDMQEDSEVALHAAYDLSTGDITVCDSLCTKFTGYGWDLCLLY